MQADHYYQKAKVMSNIKLIQCFKKKIALPPNKKSDLMTLCNNNLIPDKYKPFYEDLKNIDWSSISILF